MAEVVGVLVEEEVLLAEVFDADEEDEEDEEDEDEDDELLLPEEDELLPPLALSILPSSKLIKKVLLKSLSS